MGKVTEQQLLDLFVKWEEDGSKRLNFAEASAMLRVLMNNHGLQNWQDDIVGEVLGDTPEERHLGLCNFTQTTIYLTKFCLENRTVRQIRDTILHEIAHALCGDSGHSDAWVAKARELGVSSDEVERTLRDDQRVGIPNDESKLNVADAVPE